MRSSISNSKPAAVFYAKVLFAVCVVLILAFEAAGNYLPKHHSETFARVSRRYAVAVRVRSAKPGEPISVLMVGNSLLLEGIDTDRLQRLISKPDAHLSAFSGGYRLL